MRPTILFAIVLAVLPALAADRPAPSGPLKVFKGPEGELVAMVEVNSGKQMLVHFKNVGGEIEGQSRLYELEDQGSDRKGVYFTRKRGSKTERYYVLTQRDGRWSFYNPVRTGSEFAIKYSEKDSETLKIDDVLKAYKP